jgi:septal ring factor EnvC (AmiA/AmiB activator)
LIQQQALAEDKSLLKSISILNKKIESHLEQETEILQKKQKLELAISNLSEEIADIENEIIARRMELAQKFRYILQSTGSDFIRNLFESQNAGQLERNLKFLTLIGKNDFALIQTFRKKATNLDIKKNLETNRYTLLSDLELKLKSEETALKSDLSIKNSILNKIMRTERVTQTKYSNLFTEALKKGDVHTAEKFSLLIGKSFIDKRGYLPWPAQGQLLQKYGLLKDQEFRVTLPFKGISIQSNPGTTIRSIAFGKVVRIMQTREKSFTLLINHGRKYYTLYNNLQKISVRLNEIIKEGQTLGMSGHEPLYFEVREGTTAKNPLAWLRPIEMAKTDNNDSIQKNNSNSENWENVQ